MYLPYAFFIVLMLAVAVYVISNSKWRGRSDKFAELTAREKQANDSRKKPIPENLFFVPDLNVIPFKIDEKGLPKSVSELLERLRTTGQKKMLQLQSGMTNTEIKEAFGLVNLEFVTEYEERFNIFLRLLNDLAEEYLKISKIDYAEAALDLCVSLRCDISRTYTMLADIYAERGAREELDKLSDRLLDTDMQEAFKSKVSDYIITKKRGI